MKFGEIPVSQSLGTLVAHAVVLPKRRLKKGHVLTETDISELIAHGIKELTVARLEADDVEENTAARQIAEVVATQQLTAADAFTGRVNIYASCAGVFLPDRQLIDRLNRISPAITLATLHAGEFVEAGRMVATVKIIPFAVENSLIQRALAVAQTGELISLSPTRSINVGLVATKLPSLKPATMDKTARILSDRLRPSNSELVVEQRVDHSSSSVAAAIKSIADQCDLLIVFGASAITDRNDVIPTAIELSGGVVDYFGMPVDPGNLLLLGHLNDKLVIGAPGCARSPAENGFDWVLQRAICGLPVDEPYLTSLGVGGLLMEISARPQPREG